MPELVTTDADREALAIVLRRELGEAVESLQTEIRNYGDVSDSQQALEDLHKIMRLARIAGRNGITVQELTEAIALGD